ncbi:MAG: PCRF domain-containing protein, partial [Halioglobus sp.]|nr:PCRF domain-containing protein [Halioglobus sp.]
MFDYDNKAERLTEVRRELEQPNVWDQPARAQALGQERAVLEDVVVTLDELQRGLSDADELLSMAAAENDAGTVSELERDLDGYETRVAGLEFRRMFSGEMDSANAFVDIQSGAGGTEAQDWSEMLLRMYL